jgi:N-acetylmuramoyl-L-alanine amidase
MAFQPCLLIELGFIDHAGDLAAMVDPVRRLAACEAIAELL